VTSSSNGAGKSKSFSVSGDTTVTLKFNDRVTVTVLHDGEPVYDADVIIVGTGLTGATDQNGKVDFGCGVLTPNTAYPVDASKGSWSGSKDFTTNSDGGADVTVTFTSAYSVTIQVKHEDGTGIPSSSVVIVDSGDNVVDSGDADGNGDFQTSLKSGDYTAKVTSSANGAYKEEPFSLSGTTTVTVKFQDRVQVTVKYANGTLVKYASVEIQGTGHTGSTGSSGVVNLGCGFLSPITSYIAMAWKGDHTGSKSFTTNSDGGANVTVYI